MPTTAPATATRKPRTTTRAPKPGVTKTVPAKAASSATGRSATGDNGHGRAKPAAKGTKPDVRTTKQDIARACLDALAPVLRDLDPESQQMAVNWFHHINGGVTDAGARYWPQGILKPQRSDWR